MTSAITQMDEMTQSNASLVEEAAAASQAMGAQAEELSSLVAYFNLNESITGVVHRINDVNVEKADVEPVPQSTLPSQHSPVADDDGEWKDF